MEIEVKLQVLPDVQGGPAALFARLGQVKNLGGYPLGPVEQIDLRDVYFDTVDGSLAAARAGLRLRVENGFSLVTLKITRHQEDGLACREEYESPLGLASLEQTLAHIRPLIGPGPVPLADFAAGRAASPLLPVLTVVTQRQARAITSLATMTLDLVTYPGRAAGAFYDIEVEAAPELGDQAVLRHLEGALNNLAGGHLLPAQESKLERGLRLPE